METKKFKKIYLAILIPITVIVCICSVGYRAAILTRDITNTIKSADVGKIISMITSDLSDASFSFDVGSGSYGPVTEQVIEGEEFKNFDIDLALANVEIKEGDSYKAVVKYPEDYFPEFRVDGDTLVIKHSSKHYKIQVNGMNDVACDVTIYVPRGVELGDINLSTDLGNVEFENSVICKKLNITANLGNVEIKDAKADTLIIDADLGNVDIKDCSFGNIEITADLGDVNLKKCEFTTGVINDDLGSIEVDGKFDNLEAECSLGELNVDCDNADTAKMNLKTDLGAVVLNGRNMGDSYRQ